MKTFDQNVHVLPKDADCISRQAAINALKNDMASLDHIIKGMSGYDVRLDAYVSQRNQVDCDIDTINNLPPAQPEQRKEILYRHYKGGTYELVCNNVTHTETGESLVIYRDCRCKLWARPESMFYGLVKVGDDLVPRFVLCRSEGDAE